MSEKTEALTPRLQEIVQDFQVCEGPEKLGLLLSYAEQLEEPPSNLAELEGQMHAVHGCMTPVSIGVCRQNGGLVFVFDIPRESPTVRGFASILAQGLRGQDAETIVHLPNDFYHEMGLETLLTHQRLHGFGAILAQLKRLALDQLS
jgi:cysteine desulfuration protein SufE